MDILYCAKIKSLFFAHQDKKSFQSEQIFEVEKKTAKMKKCFEQRLKVFLVLEEEEEDKRWREY
jgi:hypothetical protein